MSRTSMKNRIRNWVERYERPLLVLAASAVLGTIILNLRFSSFEASLYDLRFSRNPTMQADPNIVLISIDDESARVLNEPAPLSFETHTRLLTKLGAMNPRAVGYLVDFNVVGQSDDHPGASRRFTDAAASLLERGVPVVLGTRYDVTGEVIPPYPLSSLPHGLALIHKDGNVFGEDKVTRRALLEIDGKPGFHLELARRLNPARAADYSRVEETLGAYTLPEIQGKYFFFRYHGRTPYTRISIADVLEDRIPASALSGKILLVGTLSRDNYSDFAFTPYTRKTFTHAKISVHGDILDSVLHFQSVSRAPEWVNWAIIFSVILTVMWWVLDLKPVFGVVATLGLATLFLVASHLLFFFEGIWLQEAQPLIAVFLGYYIAVPYRLFREYHARWEYQRKNQILTQVEELKTNFLSLVTHDLKTPVARIQGLAEVLLAKAAERLNDRDKKTLNDIVGSTDELNHFISSILELSKVESDRLHLQLQSRDINQMIERAVDGFKAPARARQIRIQTELEPLFPIRLDPRLIEKVINNLIDNAIKYSPAGSAVLVESRESGAFVEIAVSDQGVGMSATEREHLFTRFYRAKNDATASIAGTGLGLYLSRYFVEAHGGSVTVESEPGMGSTFTIRLPLDLPAQADTASAGAAMRPGLTQKFLKLARMSRKEGA